MTKNFSLTYYKMCYVWKKEYNFFTKVKYIWGTETMCSEVVTNASVKVVRAFLVIALKPRGREVVLGCMMLAVTVLHLFNQI